MIYIIRTYNTYYPGREIGRIISAPLFLCGKDICEMPSVLPVGKYIWHSNYTRGHYRRDIEISGNIEKVLMEFQCDNRITVYINGKVAYESLDFFEIGERVSGGAVDVTKYFVKGTNRIAVTAYQTGTFDRFISAMRGVFEISADGKTEYIGTDKSFEYVQVCSFWDNKEDEGWQTADRFRGRMNPLEFDVHPSALRRSVYMKKEFCIDISRVSKAVLNASAFGLFVPYVNGECITDERFLPGAMDGAKEYRSFDITEYLRNGKNVVGAILGNGWYNCTAYGVLSFRRLGFTAETVLYMNDGSVDVIPTGTDWLCCNSPVYEDDIQFGERYDARREIADWCCPGADNCGWVSAELSDTEHKPYLLQDYPPIKVTDTLEHIKKWDIGGNRIIYDFGSNNAARCLFTVKGAKEGDRFRIRYAERIPDGEPHLGVYGDVFYISDTFRDGSARGALRNCDLYICAGRDTEVYEPMFAYTGFRYIYVEYPDGFDTDNFDVKARLIHNDLEVCGRIKTSYEPLMHIWEMICRTFMSNVVGGPTDCPTREKNFWNGDIQVFCYTAMWMCDVNDFFSRWTHLGRKLEYNVYGWEDEEYVLPYKLYKFYGNTDILRIKYPVMLSLIEKREKAFEKHGNFPQGSARYRDHLSIVNVSHDFFAFCWHANMYREVSEIARILGDAEKSRELYAKWEVLKKKFNATYFIKEENDYSEHCQGGIILPVMLGLANQEDIPALVKTLVSYIEKDKGPTTGFFTTESLLMILSEYGYRELAHDIMTRDTFPSWLYLWKTGSTTITESWHGEASPYDESMNHYAFGSVGRYFFESLGGLKNHTGDMTFFEICPEICEKIGDFGVEYKTPYGVLSSCWKVNGKKGELEVVLPKPVLAKVTLPDGKVFKAFPGKNVFEFEI